MEREEYIYDDNFFPFSAENGLKIRCISEPRWSPIDYAAVSKNDLFSEERWGKSVNWNVLYEQVKNISNIINLLDEDIFPSTLFDTYLDILKANLNVFGNLFYFLTGEKIVKTSLYGDETKCVKKILHRLEFWNLDCIVEIEQISLLLSQIGVRLADILNSSNMHDVRAILNLSMKTTPLYEQNIIVGKSRAFRYAYEEYAYPYKRDTGEVMAKKFEAIDIALENYSLLFELIERNLPDLDFKYLLVEFCKSSRGKSLVKAWARDMESSRDRLIDNLEKDPKLGRWVYSYLHIRENEDVVTQLFYNENTGEVSDKEKCYNTDNWISILTIAAILQEYDELHKYKIEEVTDNYRPDNIKVVKEIEVSLHPELQKRIHDSYSKSHRRKNCKPVKCFQEFIKDASRTEEIIERLHRLIGNKTNTEALKIITRAMWIDWIDRPSASSIKKEFPTITCTDTVFSRCFNEAKPYKGGKINEEEIERIRREYEQA